MRQRHRVKISATLDPELVAGMDAYVREHPDVDRSKVLDQALHLWIAEQQRQAMIEQFRSDDRPEDESRQWRAVQRAAAQRMLRRER